MRAPIRVLLVEDNEVFRQSLAFLLEAYEDVEVVGAVADGSAAAALCEELGAEVAVIDYRLPDLDGTATAAAVRDACPATTVVFLSASVGSDERDAARVASARLVRKDEGVDVLVDAVRAAAGRAA
jgi:DNA-binding NarL/FixJ family response regulator